MSTISNLLPLASQRAPARRSFQLLGVLDTPSIETFFLSFDFDQRRAFFSGGMSDLAVRDYCRRIDWYFTTIVALSGPRGIEAIAIIASLRPPYHAAAELSIACAPASDQRSLVAELGSLAIDVAATRHRGLIVQREAAHPELLALLRQNPAARFELEAVRLPLNEERRPDADRIREPSEEGYSLAHAAHDRFGEGGRHFLRNGVATHV